MTRRLSPCSSESPPALLCPELVPVITVHENPWFRVVSRGSYYTLEYERPQVVVLPVLANSSVIMVRVRRPLIDDTPLELPAGDSNRGETPRAAAMREFAEETGIRIDDPARFVPDLPISEMPGRMPVLLSVFRIAIDEREFDSRGSHDGDIVSVEAVSYGDIPEKITSGEIYLSSPVALISRLLLETSLKKNTAGDLP
jgi:8-oxo-dGTP pyrophosphatase MutT (NUDIX family)